MSGIRFCPSKTPTVKKADKTKADRSKTDEPKAKVRNTEKYDLLRDKTAVSKLTILNYHPISISWYF